MQRAADQQRALAHPRHAGSAPQVPRPDAAAIIAHGEHHGAVAALELELDALRPSMTHDVGHRLLRHAIDRQLGLTLERGQIRVDPLPHAETGSLPEADRERDERCPQPELVERRWPQALRDLPYRLHPLAHGVLDLGHVRSPPGCDGGAQAFELQHDPSQQLAQLVVQLARKPRPLSLLGTKRPAPAVRPLMLEPVEHRIERLPQTRDLVVGRADTDAPARVERVDALHRGLEPLQRPEDPPQQHHVDRDHEADADREDHPLLSGHRRRHRRRRQG
jgi:hypothetical protein